MVGAVAVADAAGKVVGGEAVGGAEGGDVAAVLADEKVHFQMQEVAIVIADDRYIAADAVEAVEVEYEELAL